MAYVGGSPFQATDPSGMIQVIVNCGGKYLTTIEVNSLAEGQKRANALCNSGSVTITVNGEGGNVSYWDGPGDKGYSNDLLTKISYREISSGGWPGLARIPITLKIKTYACRGASVYRLNRWINTSSPVRNSVWLSHTFVITTDASGNLLNTYSWGNNSAFNGTWAQNHPNDVLAANTALAGGFDLNRVGGSIMAEKIPWAFDVLRGISSQVHNNGVVDNNCKSEADELINLAK